MITIYGKAATPVNRSSSSKHYERTKQQKIEESRVKLKKLKRDTCMDNGRHLVVESPDGSIAIAFNEDVQPPSTRTRVTVRVIGFHYTHGSKLSSNILFYISVFMVAFFHRGIDIFNTAMILITMSLLYSEWLVSKSQLLCHGMVSSLLFVPVLSIHMWDQVAYQLGCMILCF